MHQSKMLSSGVIVVLAAVCSVRGKPEVMEIRSAYSCCGNPSIPLQEHCENIWHINNKPFAYAKDGYRDCIAPCKKIEAGLMLLNECVDVNATLVCPSEMNVVREESVHYTSQLCSPEVLGKTALGHQGSIGLLLLPVLVTGFL